MNAGTLPKEFLRRQRLLVIAPHSDDETISAGGLVVRVREAGGQAYVMCFSVGDLKHFNKAKKTVKMDAREQELAAACRTLGVDAYDICYRDTDVHLRLDAVPRRDLVEWIERKSELSTEAVKPTMVVLPAPSYNQDHEAIYKAGITALRPHLPTDKAFQNFVLVADAPQLAWTPPPFFKPNFYVDISGAPLQKKLAAYRCHKSQVRPDPSHASAEALELLALQRGREISVAAAEAFECYRFVL